MKRAYTIIIILLLSLLSGCAGRRGIYANYRAVEELHLVRTLGADIAADGKIILSSAAGSAESGGAPLLLHSDGVSIPDALDALRARAIEGDLFFAHTQYVVLGQDYAEHGIEPLLDYMERNVQMRLGADLFILRGSDAVSVITGSDADGSDKTEMFGSVRRQLERRGDGHVYTVRETAAALSERGAALVCALKAEDASKDREPSESAGISVLPCGYAILRGEQLAGWAEGHTAEAISLLRGTLGHLPRSVPDGTGGSVTLEYSGRATLHAAWNADGSPAPLRVQAHLTAAIAEADSARLREMDTAALDAVSEALCAQVEEDLLGALSLSQALDADVLLLGRTLRLSSGRNFAALPADWLQQLEFDISADCEISHTYDLGNTVDTQGESGR